MKNSPSPQLHLFVCTNRRDGSTLGPGCGERGDAVYEALKKEIAFRAQTGSVWVTRTHCLGMCPTRGTTVARYPSPSPMRSEVVPADVDRLLSDIPEKVTAPVPTTAVWDAIEPELTAIEELQTQKVVALARRLKPGLTLEDIQNPHDFPELADADWNYADGILTGVKTVISALRLVRQRMGGRAYDAEEAEKAEEA